MYRISLIIQGNPSKSGMDLMIVCKDSYLRCISICLNEDFRYSPIRIKVFAVQKKCRVLTAYVTDHVPSVTHQGMVKTYHRVRTLQLMKSLSKFLGEALDDGLELSDPHP